MCPQLFLERHANTGHTFMPTQGSPELGGECRKYIFSKIRGKQRLSRASWIEVGVPPFDCGTNTRQLACGGLHKSALRARMTSLGGLDGGKRGSSSESTCAPHLQTLFRPLSSDSVYLGNARMWRRLLAPTTKPTTLMCHDPQTTMLVIMEGKLWHFRTPCCIRSVTARIDFLSQTFCPQTPSHRGAPNVF